MIEELVKGSAPALLLAIGATTAAVIALLMQFRIKQNYEQDKFRLEIEKQIAELSQQMSSSFERFNDVNHLIIEGQKVRENVSKGSLDSSFLTNMGFQKIPDIDEKLIFVLAPFNPEYDKDYKAVRDTVIDLDFICSRGDEETRSSDVLSYIVRQILRARVIVANISGRNPNVFYELGIAHALGKQVVVISRSGEDYPFNISDTRILSYKDPADLRSKLRNWIVHSSLSTRLK